MVKSGKKWKNVSLALRHFLGILGFLDHIKSEYARENTDIEKPFGPSLLRINLTLDMGRWMESLQCALKNLR